MLIYFPNIKHFNCKFSFFNHFLFAYILDCWKVLMRIKLTLGGIAGAPVCTSAFLLESRSFYFPFISIFTFSFFTFSVFTLFLFFHPLSFFIPFIFWRHSLSFNQILFSSFFLMSIIYVFDHLLAIFKILLIAFY